jgi:hypothetical protein
LGKSQLSAAIFANVMDGEKINKLQFGFMYALLLLF